MCGALSSELDAGYSYGCLPLTSLSGEEVYEVDAGRVIIANKYDSIF